MKRISYVLAIMAMVAFTACGGGAEADKTTPEESDAQVDEIFDKLGDETEGEEAEGGEMQEEESHEGHDHADHEEHEGEMDAD